MLCSQYLLSPQGSPHSPRVVGVSGAELSIVEKELASLPRKLLLAEMELSLSAVLGTSVAESLHSGLGLSASTSGWTLSNLLTHFVG